VAGLIEKAMSPDPTRKVNLNFDWEIDYSELHLSEKIGVGRFISLSLSYV